MAKKPRCRRAMKLRDKAKPGRGRVDASPLIEALTEEEEWNAFQELLKEIPEEELKELKDYFNNLDIDTSDIGDALLDEEDPSQFKQMYDGLSDDEKELLVNEMYDV